MPTPEAKVKAKVRALLKQYGKALYSCWPVPSGYGQTTIDMIGCYRGHFFGVETKAPGKKPTLRQQTVMDEMLAAGGVTFVITSVDDPELYRLRAWLDQLEMRDDHSHSTRATDDRRSV